MFHGVSPPVCIFWLAAVLVSAVATALAGVAGSFGVGAGAAGDNLCLRIQQLGPLPISSLIVAPCMQDMLLTFTTANYCPCCGTVLDDGMKQSSEHALGFVSLCASK